MRVTRIGPAVLTIVLLLSACTSPSIRPDSGTGRLEEPATPPARTLVAVVRNEPPTLAAVPLGAHGAGIAVYFTKRMFNADLALLDDQGEPRPYLAELLPELGNDTWQVFPDGRMVTTYRLRPNLFWHNGDPLTAGDFVFAWRVYSKPELGTARVVPFNLIDEVEAPDVGTVVIRWRQPYPEANVLQSIGTGATALSALPRAVMESAFHSQSPEGFANASFWSQAYVGLGPYRLEAWDPGVSLEASAFARHVLGAPKISRVRLLFRSDGNSVLAAMIAREIQLATDVSLPLGLVPEVLARWGDGGGTAILHRDQWRSGVVQLRPDYVGSPALLDVRVRRALALAVDKEAVNQAVWAGQNELADAPMAPDSDLGRAANAAAIKYPYDLRQSEQQMAAADYRKGSDGIYVSPTRGRATVHVLTNTSPSNEAEMTTIAGGWRPAGFDVVEAVNPPALGRDNETRSTFRGIFIASTSVGDQTFRIFSSSQVSRADNRWVGTNRGGFSESEYDRLVEALFKTLGRPARAQIAGELGRIFTELLPAISLFITPQPWVFVSELRGPVNTASDANVGWNMHEWELR